MRGRELTEAAKSDTGAVQDALSSQDKASRFFGVDVMSRGSDVELAVEVAYLLGSEQKHGAGMKSLLAWAKSKGKAVLDKVEKSHQEGWEDGYKR
jgi:hypothetical protein